jgi:hypothetical protein
LDSKASVTLFQNVKEGIIHNKKLREEGKDISIPFPFSRFSEEIPGIQQGRYFLTTAGTKIGKTKFTDFMFLYAPYRFVRENNTNITVKIFYFTLEMAKEDKIKEALSYFLFIKKNIRISPDKLDSIYKNYIVEDKVVRAIEELQPLMEDFLSLVTFVDHTRNPYGIYKTVRDYAHANGKYIDKHGNTLNTEYIEKGTNEEAKKIFKYVPNNPDEFVIIITDHISLLTPESKDGNKDTLHEAMSKFSSNFCLGMRDRWRYIPVTVQQQMAAQESVENARADMLRPSANGLADNKLVGRDVDMMLGLFSPFRFRRADWEGYDIRRMQDSYRELSVILNRRGGSVATGLYFDGACNFFKELPSADKMTEEIYRKVEARTVLP